MSTGVYSKTAGDLVREAMRAATITGGEMSEEPSDFEDAMNALNNALSVLQSDQIHLWSETEALLPLNPNQQIYRFGTDHCFTDYVYATVSTAAVAADVTVLVDSTVGMTAADNVGIELSTGVRFWTTIITVDSPTQITITDALTADVAVDASVYTYTTGIDQPVRVLSVRQADNQTADEIRTSQLSRDSFLNQPSKTSVGAVNSWYFSRQLTYGDLRVWPVAGSCKNILRFTFIRPQYIPTDQSEQIEIPPEWYMGLMYKVAAEVGILNAIDPTRQSMLEQKAEMYIDKAMSIDNEFSGFQFYPSCQ